MSESEPPIGKIVRVYRAIHAAGAATGRMNLHAKSSRPIANQPLDRIRDVTFGVSLKEGDPAETFTLNELVALMQLIDDQAAQAKRANPPAPTQVINYTTTVSLKPSDAAIQKALSKLNLAGGPTPFSG